jgi:hypothetical protein
MDRPCKCQLINKSDLTDPTIEIAVKSLSTLVVGEVVEEVVEGTFDSMVDIVEDRIHSNQNASEVQLNSEWLLAVPLGVEQRSPLRQLD